MSSKITSSPQPKRQKKSSQQSQQQSFLQRKNYPQKGSSFIPQGQKINFQSQDSQGSDISYQSSIQSQQDINIGQIEYFKEEMGRFFINYPELINDKILDDGSGFEEEQQHHAQQSEQQNSQGLNKNWTLIADQILKQAKQSSSFLESLSRRIALYRSKIHQEDLIDVLLKEEKNIIREIEVEMALKKKEIKGSKSSMMDHAEGADNVYFSWRKKKEMENRLNLEKDQGSNDVKNEMKNNNNGKNSPKNKNYLKNQISNRKHAASLTKLQSKQSLKKTSQSQQQMRQGSTFFLTSNNQTAFNNIQNKTDKSPAAQFSKTLHRQRQPTDSKSLTSYQPFQTSNKRAYSLNKGKKSLQRQRPSHQQDQKQSKALQSSFNQQSQTFWKHLVNFEPRTEAGRQLCELIRRTNNPNDQLGIKKTIMQYLSRNKQMVQNQIVLKSTISQKIQKLYNDDSKQLLMFYPTKMSTTQAMSSNNKEDGLGNNLGDRHSAMTGSGNDDGEGKGQVYSGMNDHGLDANGKLFDEGEKFMNLLEDIVEGPLMKYWLTLQEKKL